MMSDESRRLGACSMEHGGKAEKIERRAQSKELRTENR